MPRQKHRSLPYRPALDGLRAIAVAAVVIYHVDKSLLPGGWLGVDLFFVLSGFLITSLLLSEHHRWGSIDLIGFWLARARRLLPGLILMLLAVLLASSVFALPGRRGPIAHDVLAALCYVANWRFILGDEQYFATLAMPSPVLQTWSLAIEEQYYLFFPFLLGLLLLVFRRRRGLAAALLVLAGISVAWMAHLYVPGVDPSRVYYGTDTRAFELLIGAAAGTLFGEHDFAGRGRLRLDRWVGPAAWLVLGLLVACFLTVSDQSSWLFTGGMAAIALAIVLPILSAAGPVPSSFQRALSAEWLRQLGLLSYSLYLWHWPVIVFVSADRTHLPFAMNALVQIGLSLALSWLSLRYVERPLRTRGFAAWLPRRSRLGRAAAIASVPAVLVGSLWLPTVSAAGMSTPDASSSSAHIAQPSYTPLPSTHTVTLIGNSIPASMYDALPPGTFTDLAVSASVNFGCDPFPGAKLLNGVPQVPSESCAQWRQAWPNELASANTQIALFYVPQTLVSDWQINGKVVHFGTRAWETWVQSMLGSVWQASLKSGVKTFAVMTLSCHNMPKLDSEAALIDDDSRVRRVNSVVVSWARAHDVPVIDQYAALCSGGYHDEVNGVPLYKDTLHFSSASGAIMWNWLAPQLQKLAERK